MLKDLTFDNRKKGIIFMDEYMYKNPRGEKNLIYQELIIIICEGIEKK